MAYHVGHLESNIWNSVLSEVEEVGKEVEGDLLPGKCCQQLADQLRIRLTPSPVAGGGEARN